MPRDADPARDARAADAEPVGPAGAPDADGDARLRAAGLRSTGQRRAVLQAVDRLGHATVDELAAHVQRDLPDVSLSTVYRTVQSLQKVGLVTHAHLHHGAPTYHSVGGEAHVHLVCADCGRVEQAPMATAEDLAERLRAQVGFEVDLSHLALHGRCAGCCGKRERIRGVATGMTMQPIPAPPGSPDHGVPWHYGDPHGEQRALESGVGAVDLSHRDVLVVAGPDRLRWLHDLTTAHLADLAVGSSRLALILSPHGHVEHELHLVDDGETTWISVEPGTGEALRGYLDAMRFMLRVEVAARPDQAVVWEPVRVPDEDGRPTWLVPDDFAGTGHTPAGQDAGGGAERYVPERPAVLVGREVLVPRTDLAERLARAERPAGTWALEALRTAAAVPRLGFETDHRTLPHEVGWIGAGVHLAKGCYRGQEAIARVHNLGRPPRRLALAHLDGSAEILPAHGDEVRIGGRTVGWVATPARHHELGPIATVMLKRAADPGADLQIDTADGPVVAGQQVVVAP